MDHLLLLLLLLRHSVRLSRLCPSLSLSLCVCVCTTHVWVKPVGGVSGFYRVHQTHA